jgi:hypothetical protein
LEVFKAGLDALKNKLKLFRQFREGEKGDTHTTTRSRGVAALMENKELKHVNCMIKGKLTLSSKFLKYVAQIDSPDSAIQCPNTPEQPYAKMRVEIEHSQR